MESLKTLAQSFNHFGFSALIAVIVIAALVGFNLYLQARAAK